MSQLFNKFGILRKTYQNVSTQDAKYQAMSELLASDPLFAGNVHEQLIDTLMTYSVTRDSKQEQNLGMIHLEQALKNSTMTMEQRWNYAEQLLGITLNEDQKMSIQKAHNLFPDVNFRELSAKQRWLIKNELGEYFSTEQKELLVYHIVCGSATWRIVALLLAVCLGAWAMLYFSQDEELKPAPVEPQVTEIEGQNRTMDLASVIQQLSRKRGNSYVHVDDLSDRLPSSMVVDYDQGKDGNLGRKAMRWIDKQTGRNEATYQATSPFKCHFGFNSKDTKSWSISGKVTAKDEIAYVDISNVAWVVVKDLDFLVDEQTKEIDYWDNMPQTTKDALRRQARDNSLKPFTKDFLIPAMIFQDSVASKFAEKSALVICETYLLGLERLTGKWIDANVTFRFVFPKLEDKYFKGAQYIVNPDWTHLGLAGNEGDERHITVRVWRWASDQDFQTAITSNVLHTQWLKFMD